MSQAFCFLAPRTDVYKRQVYGLPCACLLTGQGGHVQYGSPTMLQHFFNRNLTAQEGSLQVDIDCQIPQLLTAFQKRYHFAYTGGIDPGCDSSQLLLHFIGSSQNRLLVRNINFFINRFSICVRDKMCIRDRNMTIMNVMTDMMLWSKQMIFISRKALIWISV